MAKPHLHLPSPTGGMNRAKRPTGVTMALVVLLIALLFQSAPILITNFALYGAATPPEGSSGGSMDRENGLLHLFSFAMILGVLWIWLRAKERRRFSTLGFEGRGHTWRRILRGAGAGLALIAVCVLVPVILGQATLTWRAPEIGGDGILFVGLMLIGFLVQSSTEEILLRGFITQALARRWGLIAAVIVQAVLFTLMHGLNPGMGVIPIVNLVLFALFASLWTLAEGSLWGICILHGVWNWGQGNLFGVAVSGNIVEDSMFSYAPNEGSLDLFTGGAFGIEGSLVTTLALLLGAWIAWRRFRAGRATLATPQPHMLDA